MFINQMICELFENSALERSKFIQIFLQKSLMSDSQSNESDTKKALIDAMAQIIPSIPDFSCTNEDIDMSNPENFSKPPKIHNQVVNVRCICKLKHETGDMIQCQSCQNWLHANCIHLKNSQQVNSYICIYCQYDVSLTVRNFITSQASKFRNVLEQISNQSETTSVKDKPIIPPLLKMIQEIERSLKMIPSFLPLNENSSQEESEFYDDDDEGSNEGDA